MENEGDFLIWKTTLEQTEKRKVEKIRDNA